MRILQLTKKFPFPLKDGESIAVHSLSSTLVDKGAKISLLSINTTKHYTDLASLPKSYNHYEEIHTIDVDNKLYFKDAIANLFSTSSYHISRFDLPAFRLKLEDILSTNEFDIVLLETLYLAPYIDTIRRHTNAPIVMRSHNVEYEIWERITSNTSFWPRRLYLSYLTKKLKRYEMAQLSQYDYLLTVTEKDLHSYRKYKGNLKGKSIPISIDTSDYHPLPIDTSRVTISFLGSLDWLPNLDGITWFLSNVWPQINDLHPTVKMHIAGLNTPKELYNQASDSVIVRGEVNDAKTFVNEHAIMIVPLLAGSGMRVKILEAMALGRVVITTSIGLEGIHADHNNEVIIANTPEEFVAAVDNCINNVDQLQAIGNNARRFVETYFDSNNNAEMIEAIFKKLIEV